MDERQTTPSAGNPPALSVAPMMDWTDRHCRMFHRQFSAHTLLYTEMVTASGLVIGGAEWLLAHDPAEHPLALQLGGSDPEMLARAVEMALPFGFDEINLNVGCPSDRVQAGTFGACLMREPELVAHCCAAMMSAAGRGGPRITVKSRIGVDAQVPQQVLPAFVDTVAAAGVRHFTVHARKAWLDGLSPKDNRTVPPLDYPLVYATKARRPDLHIAINGGTLSLDEAREHLAHVDGVMIGRAAYQTPSTILGPADALLAGSSASVVAPETAVRNMLPYIERELNAGTRLHRIVRHMLGAFSGRPGARAWRRRLSEGAHLAGAGPELIEDALRTVAERPAVAAQ